MKVDAVSLLRQVAKQAGKLVRRTNLLDANVCSSRFNPDRPSEVEELPGDVFHHQTEIAVSAHKVRLRANKHFVVTEIRADIGVIPLSINRADRICFWARSPLQIDGFPDLPVFSNSSEPRLREFLGLPSVAEALIALRLDKTESLHIYSNGLLLYLQPESPEEVLSAVQTLCVLVDKLFAPSEPVDLTGLPPEFQSLVAAYPGWSVSDDDSRTEMLGKKSKAELRSFLSVMQPQLAAIDSYLNAFGNTPLSDAAAALGTLAECAAEVKIILSSRTRAKR